jgi:AbiTii
MARPKSLLDQIEHDVLDESASVAGALRKCLSLGGQSGSEELRDWATVELQGYKDLEVTPLPDYRVVPAPLMIDGFSPTAHVTGQTISPTILPDFVRDDIKSEVEFRGGIGELEALIAEGEREGIVRIGLPMGSEIARLMNADLQHQYRRVERIYWGSCQRRSGA